MMLYDLMVGVVFCGMGVALVLLNRKRQGALARGQVWVGRGMIVAGVLLPIATWLLAK